MISRRGKNGGYLLARHPDDITLAEIAAAMEGEQLIESSPGNDGMSAETVHAAWLQVNQAMMEACRGITLSELIARPTTEAGADWVI